MSARHALSDRMHDFYVAREAEEIALEAAAGTRDRGQDRDASRFYTQTGDGIPTAKGRRPLTLQRWLSQTAGDQDQDRADTMAREQALDAACQATLRAETLRAEYELACANRQRALVWALDCGWTGPALARELGVSRAAVHLAAKAAKARPAVANGGAGW